MNNMKLHIVVSDNEKLFNILNNITDNIIKPKYKSIIYKKHSGLINACNKCWLNSVIQMIGYMDDIVQQIINMDPSGNSIKTNIKKLFTDLINGSGDSSGNINYGTTFDPIEPNGYGNLYYFFANRLEMIERIRKFEDSNVGLTKLFNYFFPYDHGTKQVNRDDNLGINYYNIIHKNIIIKKCLYNTDMIIDPTIISDYIYIIHVPDAKIKFDEYLKSLNIPRLINVPDNYLSGCNTSENKGPKGPYYKSYHITVNKYIIFSLNIFSQIIQNGKAINKKIAPNLYISKEIIINNNKYYLSGFIVHIGTTIDGYHYVFYKVLADGSGILYNDDRVSDISSDGIDRLLTQNIVNETPYILLYEKREFTGNICKINYNVSHYDLTNMNTFYTKKNIINDKFDCYSKDILRNSIYENFTFNQFVFDKNILYYKINITEQNKQNLNVLINTTFDHLFKNNTDYNVIQTNTKNIFIKILEFQPDCNKDLILGTVNSLLTKQSESETINNFNFKIL